MASSVRKGDGSLVLPSDKDAGSPGNYNPVTHQTIAPGGVADHTAPSLTAVGQGLKDAINGASGMGAIAKAIKN